ncbi:transcriptional regulator, GntR family [Tistlia consotensis]|uniref:Transcriptional regulator, GntR family n=1 Tax=Tistlia consotensis USBA 355 TaxID=560819 RepID=A0A1Y6CNF7_9PROT|nr:PLP-dependent aminotransferase family protein [Tistlia consotensis]SMF78252.1 transcriptional regulator, GntR family [Tistlia consotensis USBA 355]SNS18146.1 transcriptional regulator, GntR family [Tistlia consotensis]
MTRRAFVPLLSLSLDESAAEPLFRQLYGQLREAILSGRLPGGQRLPSSRLLAGELACSRNTVVGAFEQLLAEGYLEGRRGSGTYVSSVLPDELLTARGLPAPVPETAPAPQLGRRGRRLAALTRPGERTRGGGTAFVPGLPDLAAFPFDVWGRLLGRFWRHPPERLARHGDTAGYLPLRRAVADYLGAVRALRVEPEQVFVTSGAQHAVDLAARLLLDPGDRVWLEDPGYVGLRGPLVAAGAEPVPLPVDGEGLSVAAGRAADGAAGCSGRLAIVSPSHQYPLGVVMSLARRLELLAWAREAGAWIIEDDYDSEFRYGGRPLAALQGLDAGGGRVVYLGSFSKVLFPSLRLGYLVVPPALVEPFRTARAALDDHPALTVQPALAAFIAEGHFAAHVRRMRALYQARQQALLAAAERHLDGLLLLRPDEAGMHLVAELAPDLAARITDREASERACAAGLIAPPLSAYRFGEAGPLRQGLLLGYAAVPEERMGEAVARLARALA